MGIFFYEGGKPEKTLRVEELSEIFSSNVSVEFEELDAEIVKHLIDGHNLFFKEKNSM